MLDGRNQTLWPTLQRQCPHALCFDLRAHQLLYIVIEHCTDLGLTVTDTNVYETARSMRFEDASEHLLMLARLERERSGIKLDHNAWRTLRSRYAQAPCGTFAESVLAACGGPAFLTEVAASFVTTAGFEGHCKRLTDYHRVRTLRYHLEIITRGLQAPDAVDRMDEHVATIVEVSTAIKERSGASESLAGDIGNLVIEEGLAGREEAPETGSWGLERLDGLVAMERNTMNVLAARPKMGKTSLAAQAVRATAARLGYVPGSVAVATLEVDRRQFTRLMLSQETGVSTRKIKLGDFSGDERLRMREISAQWKDSVVIQDGMTNTAQRIAQWARAHARRYPGFHTLVIDHLHRLQAQGGEKEYEKLSEATNVFTWLRKELNIHILLLAQLSRESDRGTTRAPRLSDLRGSGTIEQDATSVTFLHSEDTQGASRTGEIIVAANREGPSGSFPYTFQAANGQVFTAEAREQWPLGQAYQRELASRIASQPSGNEDLFS